jgi:hypothetical protein
MVSGTACVDLNGMIFGVCIRFVPLLLSFGLTFKDTTLLLVYWLWSENASLKHTIFEYVRVAQSVEHAASRHMQRRYTREELSRADLARMRDRYFW